MSLVHERRQDFADLVEIVAAERGLRRSIVEKDYWVTHTLWALSAAGLEVWFKGGTSLSKGFGLIERFSEDLDLKIEPGTVTALPMVPNWKSEGTRATAERRAFFEALPGAFVVPSCEVALDVESIDRAWRGASLRVTYPSVYPGELPPEVSGHVLLEVGSARVTPHVPRDITSWVHEKLHTIGLNAEYDDNRAPGVRCVHPLVTLLEKIDALHRRFPNPAAPPQTFVRHYEDAARLVAGAASLPPLEGYPDVRALAQELVAQKQLSAHPTAADAALTPTDDARWQAIRSAHAAIQPMFWGPRVSLDDACAAVRGWIADVLGSPA
jgi:hypothetical protein